MKKVVLNLLILLCVGCSSIPKKTVVIQAYKGENKSFQLKDLPTHEALEVSFTVHFLGPWDGTTYKQWSPDRFFCKVDKTTLLDSTFNNCHIPFIDNIWQSFPDPHHNGQLNFETARKSSIDGTYLYHGGHGAVAIASLGFKWFSDDLPSVDSSYKFSFTIPHDKDAANINFGTIWRESAESVATYHLEDFMVKPLKELPCFDQDLEEKAWHSFFSGSPDASQLAWQNIYVTHPEKFIKRVEALVNGDSARKDYLIKQLENGPTPTESLYQEVSLDSNVKDLKQQIHRILCLRELALGQRFLTSDERHDYWHATEFTDQAKALRKVCCLASCSPKEDCAPLQKARMRLSAYLMMLNTEESIRLAKRLEN